MTQKELLSLISNSPVANLNTHLLKGEVEKSKRSKYGNKKVEVRGRMFDSKKEGSRYLELLMLEQLGEVSVLSLQVSFELDVEGEKVASYIADFLYFRNGVLCVEDVKSKATRKLPVYSLKKKLVKQLYNIEIKEV